MKIVHWMAIFAISASSNFAARNMEYLDRGLVAVKVSDGVFLSWRVLGTDAASTAFNVYRDGTKVNATPITGASNLKDASGTTASKYTVRPVINNVEQGASSEATVWASQGLTINLSRPAGGTNKSGSYTYSPNDIAVGDLDGDGQWELVLKWDPSNSKDNSQKGYTGNVFVDAYKLNGTKLWRIDLGVNIRAGAHYTQMLVGDYDSDGKAEVAMKTAPGTKDGAGAYLSKGPAASDDDGKDFRNSSGYVLTGAEYLTIFNGKTGKEMATVNYNPARGTVSSWGDSYGNRVDRFIATNAYLDGKKPSMVFQRGYYTRMAITAYDWNGTTLSQRWYYNAASSGKECYGQGNHNVAAGDVDSDGKDEIIQGSCAINDDGTFMYRTGYGHGDAMHLGDMDLDNAGLEVWEVHEETGSAYGYELHDAKTGKILWGTKTGTDNGRGVAGDVDANSPGYEMWSGANYNLYSSKGKQLSTSRPSYNFRVYWDGDLQDELLDNVTISKWNGTKNTTLMTLTGNSCNTTKATPNFSGDLIGDWREEVILHDGSSKLYLYTTTIPTTNRLYTLAHDPVYRLAMSWQNTAYNQPPHLGFFLGSGANKAPVPSIAMVGAPTEPLLSKSGTGPDNQIILLGDMVEALTYTYSNATGVTVTGLPTGVSAAVNTATKTAVISGTPTSAGSFTFTISTTGGTGTAASLSGTIKIVAAAPAANMPGNILSMVNGAYPYEGIGDYEEKNVGWIDSGYYNFTNSAESYAVWRLISKEDASNATMVIRFANGGTVARHMDLIVNGTSLGAARFAKTNAWTTYDSVSVLVALNKGLNTVRLNSMGSDGGPNIDEFEFNVAGVVLAKDSSVIDTSSSDTTGQVEPVSVQNTKQIVNGYRFDPQTLTLVVPQSGMVVAELFDQRGRRLVRMAQYVVTGENKLGFEDRPLAKGAHWLRISANGKNVVLNRWISK